VPTIGRWSVVAVAATSAVALSACGSDNNSGTKASAGGSSSSAAAAPSSGSVSCGKASITGAGSTFQKNLELQWIKDYTSACSGAGVQYNGTGSGAGIQSFSDKQVDFAGSDSLLKETEQPKADARCGTGNKAIHIPVTGGAVVLTYNLPGVSTLKLSAPVIAGIFTGSIKTWNDPKTAADNSGTTLPKLPIQPVHRSDSSGTTDIFSKFLTADAGSDWTLGTGKELKWPGGQAAKGSDGVTAGVKSAPGGITYTELSFAKANSLPVAQVKGKGSDFVDATGDTVAKALGAATVDGSKGDVRVKVDYASTATGAYPISAVTYVIACDKGNQNADSVKAFLTYATGKGQESAPSLGYAKLPDAIASKVTSEVSSLS